MRSLRPSILLTTHHNKKTVVNRKNLGFQNHNYELEIGKNQQHSQHENNKLK